MRNKTNSFKQCNDAANILLALMSYFLLLTKFKKYLMNILLYTPKNTIDKWIKYIIQVFPSKM